jgi:hypothetical protein
LQRYKNSLRLSATSMLGQKQMFRRLALSPSSGLMWGVTILHQYFISKSCWCPVLIGSVCSWEVESTWVDIPPASGRAGEGTAQVDSTSWPHTLLMRTGHQQDLLI